MIANKRKIIIAMARACINTYKLAKKANMPIPTVNSVLSIRTAISIKKIF